MASRLFSDSSHLGSACLSDASLPSATAAELVLAITSELAASRVEISARGDSRKWQTHADGSRNVSTTTSPDSSSARSFSVLKIWRQIVRPSPAGESRSLTHTPPGVEQTVI